MSAKIFGCVWELDLPHQEKYVLLALADHADHEGNNVFPSIGLVAWKTDYSERQVQRVIRKLEARGLLVRVENGGAGRGNTTEYRIDLKAGNFREPRRQRKSPSMKGDSLSPFRRTNPQKKGDNPQQLRVTFPAVKGDTAMSPESIKQPRAVTFPQDSPSVEILRHDAEACPDDAGTFQKLVQQQLEAAGFAVEREVKVADRGDGHLGRIDLVARCAGEVIALELDNQRPRDKSEIKLLLSFAEATRRFIVLRNAAQQFLDAPLLESRLGVFAQRSPAARISRSDLKGVR